MLKRRTVRNPRKEALAFTVIVLVAIALFFAVLNYKTSRHFQSSAEITQGPLHFSLLMPKVNFVEGESVPLKLTVQNIGTEDVTLKFDQELEFDFVVKRDVNLIFATVPFDVWKYSASHPGAQTPHQRVLKPGEKTVFEASWPQVDSRSEPVGSGRYVIGGAINLSGEKRQTLEVRGGRNK